MKKKIIFLLMFIPVIIFAISPNQFEKHYDYKNGQIFFKFNSGLQYDFGANTEYKTLSTKTPGLKTNLNGNIRFGLSNKLEFIIFSNFAFNIPLDGNDISYSLSSYVRNILGGIGVRKVLSKNAEVGLNLGYIRNDIYTNTLYSGNFDSNNEAPEIFRGYTCGEKINPYFGLAFNNNILLLDLTIINERSSNSLKTNNNDLNGRLFKSGLKLKHIFNNKFSYELGLSYQITNSAFYEIAALTDNNGNKKDKIEVVPFKLIYNPFSTNNLSFILTGKVDYFNFRNCEISNIYNSVWGHPYETYYTQYRLVPEINYTTSTYYNTNFFTDCKLEMINNVMGPEESFDGTGEITNKKLNWGAKLTVGFDHSY